MHTHDGTVSISGNDKTLGMDTADSNGFGASALSLTMKIEEWNVVFIQVNHQLY
jgi:hypothetical protein